MKKIGCTFIIIIASLCLGISLPNIEMRNEVDQYFILEKSIYEGNIQENHIENINYDEEIKNRLIFLKKWKEKIGLESKKYNYSIKVKEIEYKGKQGRILIEKNSTFETYNFPGKLHKSLEEAYIFNFIYENNEWRIKSILMKEEDEDYYNKLINEKIDETNLWRKSYGVDYGERLKMLDEIYSEYKQLIGQDSRMWRSDNYDRVLSAEYARKYAINYNSEYKEFDSNGQGGDCTNFASQCLHVAGIEKNPRWKPYTTSWITVYGLRDYMINNKILKEKNTLEPWMVGCVFQFYSDTKGRWSHSGIFTDYYDGEFYYSAHSYNKLDYPLSLSYPVIYSKIRTFY